MLLSAEIRWFWRLRPAAVGSWFEDSEARPGGGKTRIDEYLREAAQSELGIKVRGGKKGVELKGLIEAEHEVTQIKPFVGHVQLWRKWDSASLLLQRTVPIQKRRLLRKIDLSGSEPVELQLGEDELPLAPGQDLPVSGCNLEFTELTSEALEASWWTLGFEAFGPRESLKPLLLDSLRYFAGLKPPALTDAVEMSYPQWLSDTIMS
jgi:hypothetical protein